MGSSEGLGFVSGMVLNLLTGWDFRFKSHRMLTWNHVRRAKPLLIIGVPPICIAFPKFKI